MQGSHIDVGDVHRHLCNLVFVDIPANGLGTLERAGLHDGLAVLVFLGLAGDGVAFAHGAAFLAHIKCDGVGAAGRGSIEVEVGCDEEVAGAHSGATGACNALVERLGTEVGLLALGHEFLGDGLVLALAAHGQVAALGSECGSLVAVGGNLKFSRDALGQFACQSGAFLEGYAGNRNQRAHIGSTHAGVCAVVVAHVDEFASLFHQLEGCFDHRVGVAHKGDHGAVGGLAWVNIEQFHALGLANHIGYVVNNLGIAPFAEVGHTFN